MPCTTILIGRKASYNGATIMARNEDSGPGAYTPKKFIVVLPKDQPRHYKSVLSSFEIDLPDNPLRYTAVPNALGDEGIWGEDGINELSVAMTATETITSNYRVLAVDPLVNSGIGEEDLVTIVLPYIKSAKEGVIRLGSLIEKYGTYEKNGIGFQDANEIWWFESIGGHHWIAKKVPDDCYVVGPNQLGIDSFDFTDAYSKQINHMCSSDLADFIEKYDLSVMMDCSIPVKEITDFDIRGALGSKSDSDHCYNTPRSWYMERYLNPNTYKWDGDDADFNPESDDIPWCLVPEKKVTIDDIKYVLSSYYQGTCYNPYNKHGDLSDCGKYRPIGVDRNNFLGITEIKEGCKYSNCIQWIAMSSNPFNGIVPFFTNVNKIPDYFNNTTSKISTDNFYWTNRLIAALADSNYHNAIAEVERYQLNIASSSFNLINEAKEKIADNISEDQITEILEIYNQKISDNAKILTDKLLEKVLQIASVNMKNGYSRADN